MPDTFKERFFILTPTPTETRSKDRMGNEFPVYLDASEMPMWWSGDFPIPPIGSRVFVKMNSIGWAVVHGYFESCGYVGLMTKPTNPPAWLKRQQKESAKNPALPRWMREGIGCDFGSECSLKRPKKAVAA